MPDYYIQDTETGVQLNVEGDSEPTQADAHELIGRELDFLRTNLFQFPGGKFVLDVGPTKSITDLVSKPDSLIKNQEAIRKSWEQEKIKNPMPPRRDGEPLKDFYERQDAWDKMELEKFNSALQTIKGSPADIVGARGKMAEHIPDGSVLILSHGSKAGGHYSDPEFGAHKFTLENLAKVIGEKASGISNVFDAACYGGRCGPSDYEKAFPSVSRIKQINTNYPNVVSTAAQLSGKFYGSESNKPPETTEWIKDAEKNWAIGTNAALPKIK